MNIAIWIVAGGVLGWLGYTFLAANEARGALGSSIIGAIGGFAGGKMLAPVLGVAPGTEFSMFALMVALAGAAALLTIGNMVSNRFNI